MTEVYSNVPRKEVRWTRVRSDGTTSTAVAIVERGVVQVSEEVFSIMMVELGFVKEEND